MKHSRCENAVGLKAHLWTPKAGPGETISGQNDWSWVQCVSVNVNVSVKGHEWAASH